MAAQKRSAAGHAKVAVNRKALRDYFIEDRVEAGVALVGSEVKSLRAGKASIAEAYAGEDGGEFFLVNAHISEYAPSGQFGHPPTRRRKLLLRRREIDRLRGVVNLAGMTVVPLSLYFNERGMAKVELGVARGRKAADKRAAVKERDWRREQERLLKRPR